MRNNYANTAELKELMTAPPMTAARHAEVLRQRNARRRMLEEARELKKADDSLYDEKR
ncbi:hypothetical protein [Massilia niastensis]|uniref:hypothetical protein n=1 Tax=Massilia niastensis TaxID=544911 RepID=UPI00036E5D34|nr:hypothetical protein [Massilia niastensis]